MNKTKKTILFIIICVMSLAISVTSFILLSGLFEYFRAAPALTPFATGALFAEMLTSFVASAAVPVFCLAIPVFLFPLLFGWGELL